MKTLRPCLSVMAAGCLLVVGVRDAAAATNYVWQSSPNPTPPYNSWETAAHVIQDAVDAAADGDTVLVTNGVYGTGGTNGSRVNVDKPLSLLSVNGPEVTIIEGYQVPVTTNGDGAIRCVHLTDGASLFGFTLTNGATRDGETGGGVFCESRNAVIANCVLTANVATYGGGAYGGTLNNCLLSNNFATPWWGSGGGGAAGSTLNNCRLIGNSASGSGAHGGGARDCLLFNCALIGNSASGSGGGAYQSTLSNCTITHNWAGHDGGGASKSTLDNCIVYFNEVLLSESPDLDSNYDRSSQLSFCCALPLPSGVGNISTEPGLASAYRIGANSPCRGAGSAAFATGTDIDGEPWASPPSIGCDEFHASDLTGPLSVGVLANYTNVATAYPVEFNAMIKGQAAANVWDFGDGMVVSNHLQVSHVWRSAGTYDVVLRAYNGSHPSGISATVTVHVATQQVRYVAADGTNPVPPYTSWATAATNIQDAVWAEESLPGTLVLVTNGSYRSVNVSRGRAVRSVNGPQFTVIDGGSRTSCASLRDGATLSGFTLRNGYRPAFGGGAGVYCDSISSVVSNCVIVGKPYSFIADRGAGAYRGTLINCLLRDNNADSDGGGAYGSLLINCVLTGNGANVGGGAYGSVLINCTITDNWAQFSGGGTFDCTFINCIVVDNWAERGGDGSGEGNFGYRDNFSYSCTRPLPEKVVGNIDLDPLFVDQAGGDLRLQPDSPCIDAGDNSAVVGTADLDGNPRITSGTVDIGAYEYVPPPPDTHYVNIANPSPVAPYTNWATAAANIQDAVDAACAGDTVLVTNGVYRTGGRAIHGTMTNRVAVDKALNLESVNGPAVTIIEGYQVPGTTNGDGAIRCLYLGDGASLSGFTLTGGATKARGGGSRSSEQRGGGAWCESTNSLLTNCVITGNAAIQGGGAYQGTLEMCVLSNNSVIARWPGSVGAGAYQSALYRCLLTGNSAFNGGGAFSCTLSHCSVTANSATAAGGGAHSSTLDNCELTGNSGHGGGGAFSSVLNNCALTGNTARYGGGARVSTLNNCIVYDNTAPDQPNYDTNSILTYTCTYPMPTNGIGNITNAPLFVDTNGWADLRLQPNSPCIDAGNNDLVTSLTDLDGEPRIKNGIVDMGAYEFVPLTLAEVVQQLIDMVNESGLRHTRPLLASLEAALASIERGNHNSATGQLGAFMNKVKAQVGDPVLAMALIEGAQQVVDELEGSSQLAGKIHSLKRHPNGKMHMKIKGEANTAYILEASTNLVDWKPICVVRPDEEGNGGYEDVLAPKHPCRFYRVVDALKHP